MDKISASDAKEKIMKSGHFLPSHPSLFCDTGGGGGGEILEEAGIFSGQALVLSYPYPKGGGGPVKGAGTHSPPCPQYQPNIKPHAMHQMAKGSALLAEDMYVTHSLSLQL